MASESGKKDQPASQSDTGVKRRGLLRFGTLITALTGASAMSAIGANSANAASGDTASPSTYVPISEKGAPSGVATLDKASKILPAQLPDLSATYATPSTVTAATAPANAKNPITNMYNVRSYGAVGDGTTSDSVAFTVTKTAAGVGGTVYVPPGTYRVNGVIADVASQNWVLDPNAILKQTDTSATQLVFKITADGVTVQGGQIDGNVGTSPNGNPFQIRGTTTPVKNTIIRNVKIRNGSDSGIYISSAENVLITGCNITGITTGSAINTVVTGGASSKDIQITKNYIDQRTNAPGGGITFAGTSSLPVYRAIVTDNIVLLATATSGQTGMGCIGGAYVQSYAIANNTTEGGYITISMSFGIVGASITGNKVKGFYSLGIESAHDSQYVTIANNYVDATGAVGQAIAINDSPLKVSITGNTCLSNSVSSLLYTHSGATDVVISGNAFTYTGSANEIVAINGSRGVVFSGNILTGSVAAGFRVIGSPGDIVVNGNKFVNMTTAAIIFDTNAQQMSIGAVVGNIARNVPLMYSTVGGYGTANLSASGNIPSIEPMGILKWYPFTVYTAGQQVVSPNGDIVSAPAHFTSGATFDPTNWSQVGTVLNGGESVLERLIGAHDNLPAVSSGGMLLSYFTAKKTETITKVRVASGATAAGATPTLVRVGIFTVSSAGVLTLVASTSNDTTLLATASTVYTPSLSASFAKVAGTRYAVGILVVTGAAMPTLMGLAATNATTSGWDNAPRLVGYVTGQSDLPSSFSGGISSSTRLVQYDLVP